MFQGKLTTSTAGLYVDKGIIYPGKVWGFEGKRYDNTKAKYCKVLSYAEVVYVTRKGDIWYHAPQNNYCLPVVRIEDRKAIYAMLADIGIDVLETDHNNEY